MALRTSSRAESSWKCRTVASTSCWWSPTAAVGARVTRQNGGASRGDSAPDDAIWQWVGRHRLWLKRLFFSSREWRDLFTVATIYLGTEW